ncbi:MAG: lipoyl synthase [Syntrophales bacterium]
MKPSWIRSPLPDPAVHLKTRRLLRDHGLNTVCEEALCPNQCECFSRRTAAFLILGRTCTRACTFCAIPTDAHPPAPDPQEPERVAAAAVGLGLRHVVITSVTRDDLADGGAGCFAATVAALRRQDPSITVEVLIPDLKGDGQALEVVLGSRPDVVNHNLETVGRLYKTVRPQADYRRSLDLLRAVKAIDPQMATKSGLMLGLGEERGEVLAAMADLREAACELLTLGQYLRPSPQHHPVVRYVPPAEFAEYGRLGEGMGFRAVFSAPLVRSSFHAAELYAGSLGGHRYRPRG